MPASIFNGPRVKALKNTLSINDNAYVITGDPDDPTVVAKDAPIGSEYIRSTTGAHYLKTDSGSSTNWLQVSTGASTAPSLFEPQNLGLSASATAGAMTISLKQKDGVSDPTVGSPVYIPVKLTTAGSTGYAVRAVTSALSITLPSGASLGNVNGNFVYTFIYAIDNAGTIELAVSATHRDEEIVTTTAISAAATTDNIYSTTARASVSMKMIGRITHLSSPGGSYVNLSNPLFLNVGNAGSLSIDPRAAQNTVSVISSVKTPTASDAYHSMAQNSLFFPPGTYEVFLQAVFTNGGTTPNYASGGVGLFAANGADTATTPASLTTNAGITTVGAFSTSTLQSHASVPASSLIIVSTHRMLLQSTTSASALFVVPYSAQTTSANARITVYATSRRIR